ncbi:hypothetical protein [Sporolactobacillus nakayamae]|uniref:Uncharacterized protein n=1 Tax=Sporolactobacillus nakayamae TaxID=269670 RepID=A0A1I2QU05_9BACL|nr:hypothetical protein [Sporolactobacillus nakayamae]SFG31902.1 hypothetical protein SAMN02982927_01338 [Sporolactobacillus nakayamae]
MAVEKVFWKDSYLTQIDAVVTSVAENSVTVSQTVAYAFTEAKSQTPGLSAAIPFFLQKRKAKTFATHCLIHISCIQGTASRS